MTSGMKKCRVCGKDYKACHSVNKATGIFRWQEVACSPECGTTYLQRIRDSRIPTPKAANKKRRKSN